MRKKDDKVGNKTHGYTKKEGRQKEKKKREKALKEKEKKKKKLFHYIQYVGKNMPLLLQMRAFVGAILIQIIFGP